MVRADMEDSRRTQTEIETGDDDDEEKEQKEENQ